ncbi:MAG: DUF4384 domain-containing protein [Bacteroidales bacterium]|jgi:hypothetical protein|nr:DUF4384 domain-containing protein [Bacteroidales bacterium]
MELKHNYMKFSMFKSLSIIIFVFIFSFNQNLTANNKPKEIKVKNIKGIAIGAANETLLQVKSRAINDAKINALKKAGIVEDISSYSNFFKSENKNNYNEIFTSDILSDIRGAVKNVEELNVNNSFNDAGLFKVEVIINCTVLKYKSKNDLTFDAWIGGFGMYYKNHDYLKFKIKASKNAYLKVFLFSETEAYILFPNDYEKNFQLLRKTEYIFPIANVDYELETSKKSETHRAIVVLTKKDIPYTKKVQYKNIVDWIFTIPPDERIIKTFGFSVVNENKME